jgi:hypothetical protein
LLHAAALHQGVVHCWDEFFNRGLLVVGPWLVTPQGGCSAFSCMWWSWEEVLLLLQQPLVVVVCFVLLSEACCNLERYILAFTMSSYSLDSLIEH